MTSDITHIRFGSGNLFIRSVGQGPPILFVHGWPLHGLTWRHVASRLADRWRCHLIDLPGAGESGFDAKTDFSAAGMAAAVRASADGLGLSRYALVAFDLGGTIARLVAASDPRVSALVLGNTEIAGHRPPWVPFFVTVSRLPGSSALFKMLLRSRAFRRSKMGYGGCFHDRSLIDGEFHDLFVRPLLERKAALAGQLGPLHAFDWRVIDGLDAVHRTIDAPVKLIWGAGDGFFPLAKARPMALTFKRPAELAVIQDARLLVNEERPDAFAAEIATFLEKVQPWPAGDAKGSSVLRA